MADWREQILGEFHPQIARLTLAYDPDELLLEQQMLDALQERGFAVMVYDEPVQFRFVFELEHRSLWDDGDQHELIVIVPERAQNVPYDLVSVARQVSFSIGELFPNLNSRVLSCLDRAEFDAVSEALEHFPPGILGENATKDFLLRHVFEIAPELIKSPVDLMRVILRRHYSSQRIPEELDQRLLGILRRNFAFADLPLERILSDREAFLEFLQEHWARYITESDGGFIPFEHHDIRIYIDSYFAEGLLTPVEVSASRRTALTWQSIGVISMAGDEHRQRLNKLIESIKHSIPDANARYTDWCRFAFRWAELQTATLGESAETEAISRDKSEYDGLAVDVDSTFRAWMMSHYGGLANLPPHPPVMVHHIPRMLARRLSEGAQRVAMLVIDGLSLAQWRGIRDIVYRSTPHLAFREAGCFAWVPTLTSVSRQAMFAGVAPIFFPDSINQTNRESTLWTRFWSEHGLKADQVGYLRGIGTENVSDAVALIEEPSLKALGLVLDTVDRIMHGMELGAAGMLSQVRHWAATDSFAELLRQLIKNRFHVVIASDHGNIEATGCGRPSEGSILEMKGERVRIYQDIMARDNAAKLHPEATPWCLPSLPPQYLPLFAPERRAFIQDGNRIVAHGGISIDEIIVPVIEVGEKLA